MYNLYNCCEFIFQDEILAADICTPAFETECMAETITVKKIIEVDFCFNINKTVCSVTQEKVSIFLCPATTVLPPHT